VAELDEILSALGWHGGLKVLDMSRVTRIADTLESQRSRVMQILTGYETWRTAEDEFERAVRTLRGLHREAEFSAGVRRDLTVAAYLPVNQPLYGLVLFGVVPAMMTRRVAVRPSEMTHGVVRDLFEIVTRSPRESALVLGGPDRTAFLADHVAHSSVTIFTGTPRNARIVGKSLRAGSCLIYNGSGVNPIIVGPGADVDAAATGIVRAVTYNSGQDCASPDAVFVHNSMATALVEAIARRFARLSVGPSPDPATDVGPIQRWRAVHDTVEFLGRASRNIVAGGRVDLRRRLVEPAVVVETLRPGTRLRELYAPVVHLLTYSRDDDLTAFLNGDHYQSRAMYATTYGHVPTPISNTIVLPDLLVIDHEDGNLPFGGAGPDASYYKIGNGRPVKGPVLVSEVLSEYSSRTHGEVEA
jgi:acyl-CoA reductase-like NAD-dependent aldehyde dehydrogenase